MSVCIYIYVYVCIYVHIYIYMYSLWNEILLINERGKKILIYVPSPILGALFIFFYFSLTAFRTGHHCIYYKEKTGSEKSNNLIKWVQVINSLSRSQLLVHLSTKILPICIILCHYLFNSSHMYFHVINNIN